MGIGLRELRVTIPILGRFEGNYPRFVLTIPILGRFVCVVQHGLLRSIMFDASMPRDGQKNSGKFPLLCELSKMDMRAEAVCAGHVADFLYSVNENAHVSWCWENCEGLSSLEKRNLVEDRNYQGANRFSKMPLSPRGHGERMLQQAGVKLDASVTLGHFHGDSLHFAGDLWHFSHPTHKLRGDSILRRRPGRSTEILWNSLCFGLLGLADCHSALDPWCPMVSLEISWAHQT